jgi:hypothetical protein
MSEDEVIFTREGEPVASVPFDEMTREIGTYCKPYEITIKINSGKGKVIVDITRRKKNDEL